MMFGSEWPLDFSTHCPGVIAQSGVSLSLQWIFPFVSKKKTAKWTCQQS
jgi:hypothetical protein